MMRKLPGLLGAVAILWGVFGIGSGCTPTDREFSSGGQGGDPGCPAGFVECDGNPETVCETDTTTSMEHCGTCNNACAPALDANIACVAGTCSITSCSNGKENCDNFYDNGCETSPTTSFEHCGTCGNSCEAPDAITACVAGACALAQCVNGKLDCDMDPKTGCEVDPATNVDHCGACGNVCTSPNATMTCMNATCTFAACNANFDNCNQNVSDGCETDLLSDPYNCGTCGNYCDRGACKAGVCYPPTFVTNVPLSPGKLAIFKGELFIGARANPGDVATVSTTGGTVKIIPAGIGTIHALAANSDGIFVAASQGMSRFSFDGSNKFSFGTQSSRGVAFTPTRVYWTALNAVRESSLGLPLPGTFTTTSTTALGLFIDPNDIVYWTTSDGSVWSSPASAPAPTQIALGPSSPLNIVADDLHVYWSSGKGLHMVSVKGGDVTVLETSSTIRSIALDATHIYWTDEGAMRVLRMVKGGSSPPETLAIDQNGPFGLALDAQYVYWSNSDSNEIWKLPK